MEVSQKPLYTTEAKYPRLSEPVYIYGIVISVVVMASVLTTLFLGKKSIWLDEAISITLAKQDWTTFWFNLSKNTNMDFYHLMLHWWVNIGQSEFVVRALSVIFALVTVPVTFALGSRLFGSSVGIIAALFLTVNPFFVQYAQEARAYSLVLMLVTLSSYFFVICIEQPSKKYWIAYIVSSVLAVYSHLFAVLVLLTHAASLAFLRRKDVQWRGFLISVVAITFMIIPFSIKIIARGKYGLDWIQQPDIDSLLRLFYNLVGRSQLLLKAYIILCLIALILAIWTLATSKRSLETWRYFYILGWLIIPIVLVFSYSFYKPMFAPRYFIICLTPFVLFASIGLSNLQRISRWIFLVFICVMLIQSGNALVNWYTGYDKAGGEDWRQVTSYVLSKVQKGDTIFFVPPDVSLPFDYYLHRLHSMDMIKDPIYNSSANHVKSRFQKRRWPEFDKSFLDELPAQYHRVWLVGMNLTAHQDTQNSLILGSLQRNYELIDTRQFKKITLLLYETLPPQ